MSKHQIEAEDPIQIETHFEKFLQDLPPELAPIVTADENLRKFMYGAFLAGYRRGMSITLLQIDKALKEKGI